MHGDLAQRVHEEFQAYAGSGWIFSEYALRGLAHTVARRKPRNVLEVGAGIGTSTRLLLDKLASVHPDGEFHLYSIEPVSWCRHELRANLGRDAGRLFIVEQCDDLPHSTGPFDLVVIDGGTGEEVDGGIPQGTSTERENRMYVAHLAPRATIFVENKRTEQRRMIEGFLTRPWIYAHYRPWNDAPGYHIYRLEPTARDRAALFPRQVFDRLWLQSGASRIFRRAVRKTRRQFRVYHR